MDELPDNKTDSPKKVDESKQSISWTVPIFLLSALAILIFSVAYYSTGSILSSLVAVILEFVVGAFLIWLQQSNQADSE